MIEKEEELEEISSMAGGSVGGSSVSPNSKKKKKSSTIFREEEEESQLRKVVQEIIKNVISEKNLLKQKRVNEEKELRSIIRSLIKEAKQEEVNQEKQLREIIGLLIKEAKKDIEAVPHPSTAINLLEEMLKQILPNLETDYKTLTTKKEQRDSFRAHVVNAVSDLLETEDVNKAGGTKGEEGALLNLEEDDELEEIEIKVSDIDATADDKFIDIEPEEVSDEEEVEDTFGLEGQDETGRALAQEAFNNIEKNITETYAILHDDKDEKLFKDYLITNLKLYFDKWEKELGAVTEPTTDEYEAEKAEDEAGAEAGAEFGGEFGGEARAATGGEELIQ